LHHTLLSGDRAWHTKLVDELFSLFPKFLKERRVNSRQANGVINDPIFGALTLSFAVNPSARPAMLQHVSRKAPY
jgi:hypothetical protein